PLSRSDSGGRRRSNSLPQRPPPAIFEPDEEASSIPRTPGADQSTQSPQQGRVGRLRSASVNTKAFLSRQLSRTPQTDTNGASSGTELPPGAYPSQEYEAGIVDMLDVIDPEVSTLTTLNNVQNSLFTPYLGSLFRPTYNLTPRPGPTTPDGSKEKEAEEEEVKQDSEAGASTRRHSITSQLSVGESEPGHNYAVLPHGISLEGWSEEAKEELNDHVRHLLHSRRAAFKRSMRGFGQYVRKPIGFLITLYAFLLTFWGAAWVLFLIGWLHVGDRQAYFIEICDQILTALFCVVGIGLAPFRAVDTYHMAYIAHYHKTTWRLRREQALPKLRDHNDLPEPSSDPDVEAQRSNEQAIVLTPEQQKKLEYHQHKFSKSHSFYKPHETLTHRAFSLRLLITIVTLLDAHSLFQMALGGTTWGIYYKDRPPALTATILCCSISCNISAGIIISVGDKRSRKKEVVERLFRQALTEQAIHKIEKKKGVKAKRMEEE
ncbi:hypothetical protein M501DRAFT_905828, partial [Patellaria atrata CBS 101060]